VIARRGIALLIVLATLVVSVAAAAITARAISLHKATSEQLNVAIALGSLLPACDEVAIDWLDTRSKLASLPATAPKPVFTVLDDEWTWDSLGYSIKMNAYDQLGMVPWSMLDDARFRAFVPSEERDSIGQALDAEAIPGLDAWWMVADGWCVFPAELDTESETSALGSLVATHNPMPLDRRAPAAINLNTAPWPIVEAALRISGRSGIERIRSARSKGELAPVPALDGGSASDPDGIVLVSTSPTWSIRTDIRAGRVHRAWWSVYTHTERSWRLVQRLAIPE